MRRLLVVLALLALMVGVKSLQATPGEGASDPLTLATIGFVLLAAFTLAESGAVLRLPRVTGYIVGGALLGPSVSNLLHEGVVSEMRMFNTLALGLIALSAGLELDVRQIAKVWRTLVATIAFKLAFLGVLVGGGLVLFERFFPSLGLASQAQVYALALVFFALAIGTSPSITLALLSELRSKGRPADLFLGAAVLKDLVVVVALALAVALARPLLGAEAAGHGGLGAVAVELGGSMLVGLVLGGLLVAYIRFVNAEMLLFVAAMILVVSELSRALHLELLLVFIAAGFVVRNFSKYEHELMGPVSLVALPVFVVFFTNAGASIDIARTLRLLPIALALSALRALGLWGAAGLGARVGGEAAPIRRYSWLGYVPQAGVTLGLVAIAAQQLPMLAESIAGLGMAVVAINLLVGPLTLRLALTKLGGEQAPIDRGSRRTPSISQPSAAPEASDSVGTGSLDAELRRWSGELGPPQLREAIHSLCSEVLEVAAAHRRTLEAHAQEYEQALSAAFAAGRSEPGLVNAEQRVAALAWLSMQELSDLSRTAFRHLRDRMRALPAELLDPVDASHLQARRGDSLWMELRRWRRRSAMLFSKRARLRRIPLQMAARVALERRCAEWASRQLVDYARLRAALTDTLERYLRGELSSSESVAETERVLGGWPTGTENDLRELLQNGVVEIVSTCLEADLPGADPRGARLSLHDRQIVEQLSALERHAPLWQRILDVLGSGLRLEFQLARARVAFSDALSGAVAGPAERALTRLDHVLAGVSQELTRLAVQLTADEPSIHSVAAGWRRYLDRENLDHLEEDAAGLHAATVLQRLGLELRRKVGQLPDRVEVLRTPLAPQQLADPASVGFRSLDARAIAGEQLMDRLLPRLEEHLESVAAGMEAALETLHGIEAMASHAIEERDTLVLERAARQAAGARTNLSARQQQSVVTAQADARQAFSTTATLLSHQVAGSSHEEATTFLSRSALIIGRAASQSLGRLQRSVRSIGSRLARLGQLDLALRFRARLSRGALDGATMASLIETIRQRPELPPNYAQLFAAQPVREPRLFCARESELRAVLGAEARSVEGAPSSVLIVGAHGSGRTSLLNVAQLELRAARVLRPQPGQAQRRGELLRALAVELDCRPDARSLLGALAQAHTTVLVDDLEHWFEPNLVGVARLDEFVQLVSATRATVCFVVAVSSGAFQIFRELVPLEATFTRHVRLPPLGAGELQKVIEARQRLSGMPLDFQSEFGFRWLRLLGSEREGTLYFRLLRRMTNGNLALALKVFLASVNLVAGRFFVRTEHPLSLDLSFLGELDTQQLAALNQALRFGGVDEHSLQGAGEVPSGVEVHLAFLRTIGLLIAEGPRRGLLSIPADLRPIVEQALVQRGAGSAGET